MGAEFASSCDTDSACPSTGSVLGLFVVVAAAGVLFALTWWAHRRARRADRRSWSVITAATFAVAVFLTACLLSSLRHFGGQYNNPIIGSGYRCAPLYVQLGRPRGIAYDGTVDTDCRTAAIDSLGPALADCAGIAVFAGALGFASAEFRRRRFDRRLQNVTAAVPQGRSIGASMSS